MRVWLLISILLAPALTSSAFGQGVKKGHKWRLYGVGANYMFTATQYFEGYDHKVLIANSRAGLPTQVYTEAHRYTALTTTPDYFQAGGWLHLGDSARTIRMRVMASYAKRRDYLNYQGNVEQFDSVRGWNAQETVNYFAAGFGVIKSTKILFRFLRLYAGAELEVQFGPGSDIEFVDFLYDVGDEMIVAADYFYLSGKPRFVPFASAMVGMEFCFWNRVALTAEAKSGFGGHLIVKQTPVGISKSQLVVGVNYFFRGY